MAVRVRKTRAQGPLAFLVVLLLVVAVIIAWYYFTEIWRAESHETEQLVKLGVDLSESGEWRSGSRDLPLYTSTVTYTISNYGTATADGIQVTIRIDGVVFKEFPLPSLASNDSFTDQFSISVNCDSSKEVSLTASCEASTDTETLTISAILTRTFSSKVARLYISPNDSTVQQTLDNIVKNPLIPDWIEIRDWVANNIEYPSDDADGDGEPDYDYIRHGQWDYWQLPRETLSLRTGDCEDFSILLCTLLRANGWDENEVYVVLGEKDGNYHGWVKLNVDIIGWQNIESQAGALNTFIGDFLSLSGYNAKYNFNDVYFKTV